ncbi:hypothetical protein M975_1923 [Buttiauxella brennerae ATCC 51605]|uniref:Uncharacterized protein n=1 Tax=Buttiauxella brennerae ATCC 51605 TaxID=1354251 RepID=A0A1B7IQN7_9ENTR|nr:hypothetical protein [Buttiauxella brennerae]OAT32031.1 hypothetical protein M975_1923 [Buttiauxella brennerae ATCC 51605]
MSLKELTLRKQQLESDRTALRKHYESESNRLASELVKVSEQLNFVNAGLNEVMIQRGKEIVYFGKSENNSKRKECVTDAISDLASGCERLKTRYFGTKNYDRWSDQREDHEYGYGPRHGCMVFKVGLTTAARLMVSNGTMNDHDIECAIYCLMNIDQINKQIEDAEAA